MTSSTSANSPDISSGISLRPYQQSDAAAIAGIYAHYVQNSAVTFDTEAPGEEAIREKFDTMTAAHHPVLVAETHKEVVGFAYASTFRPRAAYRFTCENAIYLLPEAAGRGVGSKLLGELIVQSRKSGFNQMVAIITAGTKNSIALHKKFGFEVLGEFPELGFKFNKWHAIVHMQLKL